MLDMKRLGRLALKNEHLIAFVKLVDSLETRPVDVLEIDVELHRLIVAAISHDLLRSATF